MGLRLRLNLLLSLLFFLALAVAVLYLLANTRRAVVDELSASTELASELLRGFRDSGSLDADPRALEAIATHLGAHGPLRHLRILLDDTIPVSAGGTVAAPMQAPTWFARLVAPDAARLRQQVVLGAARVRIVADASAEVDEAWREVRTTLIVLIAAFVGANVVAFVFLGYALTPLRRVSAALEGVGRGRYATRVSLSGIPDIDVIVDRFNDMAAALEASEHDNTVLARRSLAIQADERRRFAHELHDEMGQSITAIKALAVSIGERVDGALAERAGTIVEVSSEVYARVRQMMTRLHPVILDELGLVAALELMVDDWNDHHEECFCELSCERDLPSLDDEQRIGIYRIVQEALTNVARHAHASKVQVELRAAPGKAGESTLLLSIADNGVGFTPASSRPGLGLRGMRERAQALGGRFLLASGAGQGTRTTVELPLGNRDEDDIPR
ncbi:MAG: histidine kinase [Gammaproteobacteria bacterium]